jgi:hypothetical protein
MARTMDIKTDVATRDRAIWVVRLATLGGTVTAIGLSWLFADLSKAYFSGHAPDATSANPPQVPAAAAPVQKAPPVIKTIVHHPYQPGVQAPAPTGSGPRPPGQKPAPAPAPPPPPPCKSTPSKPC